MYLIFSVLAGLMLLTGTTKGMHIPYNNMDPLPEADVTVSDDNYLRYLLRQEEQKTESIASSDG